MGSSMSRVRARDGGKRRAGGRSVCHLHEDAVKHGNSREDQAQEKDHGEKEICCGSSEGAGGRRAGGEESELTEEEEEKGI